MAWRSERPRPCSAETGHRLAEAEAIGFDGGGSASRASALLASRCTGLPALRSTWAKRSSSGVTPARASIMNRMRSASAMASLGLLAHAVFEAAVAHVLVACGVEDVEAQIGDAAFGEAPVPGHARGVVDKRYAPADEAVEQGRLAHIGTPDNGDGDRHGRSGVSPRPARQRLRARSRRRGRRRVRPRARARLRGPAAPPRARASPRRRRRGLRPASGRGRN
jgi:hypothetical protein